MLIYLEIDVLLKYGYKKRPDLTGSAVEWLSGDAE
jgi:hypothetical protein